MKRLAAIEEELMQLQKLAGLCADGQTERVEVSITVFRESCESGIYAKDYSLLLTRQQILEGIFGRAIGLGMATPETAEEVEEAFVDNCNADIALRYIELMRADREKEKQILAAKLKKLISK